MRNNTTTKKSECRFISFGVHIKCTKLQKSIDFYRNLGLVPEFAYGSPEFRLQFKKTAKSMVTKSQFRSKNIPGVLANWSSKIQMDLCWRLSRPL